MKFHHPTLHALLDGFAVYKLSLPLRLFDINLFAFFVYFQNHMSGCG
jgi:hypothetical protein